jgi:hypothetical protein
MNVCLMEDQILQMMGRTCSSMFGHGASSSGSDIPPPPPPKTIVGAFTAAKTVVMCQILQTQQQLAQRLQ